MLVFGSQCVRCFIYTKRHGSANSGKLSTKNQSTDNGSGSGMESDAGGNPGSYFQTSIDVYSSSTSRGVHVFYEDPESVYFPAEQVRTRPSTTPKIRWHSWASSRAGRPSCRMATSSFLLPILVNTPDWTTHQFFGLSASDFISLNTDAHPDFSETGGLITFGFMRFAPSTSPDESSTLGGIANWSFTVNQAP